VTIITPSFNQGEFIEETIRSVLLQNYPNLQYIIIDGGSTDNTTEKLKQYSPWIDHWVSEPDRGQSHAIIKGLAQSNGNWVNWLNSDDFLLPRALHSLAEATSDIRAPLLVGGRLQALFSDGSTECLPSLNLHRSLAELLVNHHMAQPAMFYRRDAFPSVSEELHLAMDFEMWTQFLCKHSAERVIEIDTPVAVFRHHPNAKTTQQAVGFEAEERAVLRNLVACLGGSKSFQTALSQTSRSKNFDTRNAPELSELAPSLIHRYLWGDLRQSTYRHGWKKSRDLRDACAEWDLLGTYLIAAKAWFKRLLHRPLDT